MYLITLDKKGGDTTMYSCPDQLAVEVEGRILNALFNLEKELGEDWLNIIENRTSSVGGGVDG